MRIQNNITAMNTHRQYTINNDNVAKAAEKLSSGYRINRAGDDAAGLAISEKMRSQIRGLNMATKNSQDAISLVQTAEGALQETHAMLQRMNELAVQAATGTNEALDRSALAREFEQLKREINDVAEQTNFNNMKILDGSMSYTGYVRSAQTAGITNTASSLSDTSPAITSTTTAAAPATAAKITGLNLGGAKDESIAATKSATLTVTIPDPDGDATKNTTLTFTATNASTTDAATVSELFADGIEATGNTDWKASVGEDGTVTLTNSGTGESINAGEATMTLENDGSSVSLAGTKVTATGAKIGEGTYDYIADGAEYTVNVTLKGKAADGSEDVNLSWTVTGDGSKTAGTLLTTAGAVEQKGWTMSCSSSGTLTLTYNGDPASTNFIDTSKAGVVVTTSVKPNGDTTDNSGNVGANASTSTAATTTGTIVNGTDPATKGTAVDGTDNTPESSLVTVNAESLKVGDKITIAGKTYELVSEGQAAAGQNVGIEWGEGSTLSDLIDGINADAPTGVTIAQTQDKDGNDTEVGFTVTQDKYAVSTDKDNYVSTAATFQAGDGGSYKNTIELDTVKMKDGDKFTLNIGGASVDITFDSKKYTTDATKTAAEKMAADIQTALAEKGVSVDAKGNAIIFNGGKVSESDIKLTSATEDSDAYPTNAVRIQVGALENEQLAISIDAMNTAGLGLDGFNLDTQNEAGMAITAVRSAINKVSDQRATLGAMQNRLDHKIANLKVASENLSASESRIRDVDMAQEMTNFTKNNILSQAATAMLAQANALPQNVLSLLG